MQNFLLLGLAIDYMVSNKYVLISCFVIDRKNEFI